MRLTVLLTLCAGLTGCSFKSSDSAMVDKVTITSSPSAAAVRLNGKAVGRTPTEIEVDRSRNYLLEVGKTGYRPESASLKPRLINTRRGMEYGFPETVNVTLTRSLPGESTGLSKGDEVEFNKLTRKVNGSEDITSPDTLATDIASIKDATERIRTDLAARESSSKAKLEAITKRIADLRAGKQDPAGEAQLGEARLALKEAETEAESVRSRGTATLKSLETRRIALEAQADKVAAKQVEKQIATTQAQLDKSIQASDAKITAAQTAVNTAKTSGESPQENIARLEAAYAAETAAAAASQTRTNEILRALSARADELARAQAAAIQTVQKDSSKEVHAAQKALEEREAKVRELTYSEFSARYALLENRFRNKAISEAEYKQQLAELRKELGL